ncbi:MAG: ribose 5-phosphate isomerase B [Deltaproteobacteria bacterium]|nr:ribose 5-phosphate isomerase B [Deltaproteobacteria bacterium]
MKVAIGFDHAGVDLRAVVIERIRAAGHEILDFGTDSTSSVDYPDHAHLVARAVENGEAALGVLVCGTGLGMSYAANRHPGVRAAVCTDSYLARMARLHNDANVLCLGARVVGAGVAGDILDAFFATGFEGGRHARRLEKIERTS